MFAFTFEKRLRVFQINWKLKATDIEGNGSSWDGKCKNRWLSDLAQQALWSEQAERQRAPCPMGREEKGGGRQGELDQHRCARPTDVFLSRWMISALETSNRKQISIGLGVDVAAAHPRRSVYWIFKCFLWKWLNKMIFWDSIVISIFPSFYFLLISSKISPVNQIYKEQAGVFPAHTSWVIKASYRLHLAFE